MKIESERHPLILNFSLVLTNIFAILICLLFYTTNEVNFKHFGLFFIVLVMPFDYLFLKNSPKIVVDRYGITFGKETYLWEDLTEMKISTKGQGFLYSQKESTKIRFKNGDVIYIYENHHANSHEIRDYINQVVINKSQGFEKRLLTSTSNNLYLGNFTDFKGHLILSFRGIMMWSLLIFLFLYPFYDSRKIEFAPLVTIYSFCVIWFLLNSWMMYYFRISNKHFIIKNHYFFWIEKIYLLENIEEVVYEQQGKQSNALRIITKDFKSKRFLAGSLNDQKWLEMKDFFEEKNIKVRNECI